MPYFPDLEVVIHHAIETARSHPPKKSLTNLEEVKEDVAQRVAFLLKWLKNEQLREVEFKKVSDTPILRQMGTFIELFYLKDSAQVLSSEITRIKNVLDKLNFEISSINYSIANLTKHIKETEKFFYENELFELVSAERPINIFKSTFELLEDIEKNKKLTLDKLRALRTTLNQPVEQADLNHLEEKIDSFNRRLKDIRKNRPLFTPLFKQLNQVKPQLSSKQAKLAERNLLYSQNRENLIWVRQIGEMCKYGQYLEANPTLEKIISTEILTEYEKLQREAEIRLCSEEKLTLFAAMATPLPRGRRSNFSIFPPTQADKDKGAFRPSIPDL